MRPRKSGALFEGKSLCVAPCGDNQLSRRRITAAFPGTGGFLILPGGFCTVEGRGHAGGGGGGSFSPLPPWAPLPIVSRVWNSRFGEQHHIWLNPLLKIIPPHNALFPPVYLIKSYSEQLFQGN